jgi:hypothetical protein
MAFGFVMNTIHTYTRTGSDPYVGKHLRNDMSSKKCFFAAKSCNFFIEDWHIIGSADLSQQPYNMNLS